MKKIVYAIFAILLLVIISNGLMWLFNQEMFQRIKKMSEAKREVHTEDLKSQRIKMEKRARLELKSYRWIDQRKNYAEIPIDRAFDYYLLSTKP